MNLVRRSRNTVSPGSSSSSSTQTRSSARSASSCNPRTVECARGCAASVACSRRSAASAMQRSAAAPSASRICAGGADRSAHSTARSAVYGSGGGSPGASSIVPSGVWLRTPSGAASIERERGSDAPSSAARAAQSVAASAARLAICLSAGSALAVKRSAARNSGPSASSGNRSPPNRATHCSKRTATRWPRPPATASTRRGRAAARSGATCPSCAPLLRLESPVAVAVASSNVVASARVTYHTRNTGVLAFSSPSLACERGGGSTRCAPTSVVRSGNKPAASSACAGSVARASGISVKSTISTRAGGTAGRTNGNSAVASARAAMCCEERAGGGEFSRGFGEGARGCAPGGGAGACAASPRAGKRRESTHSCSPQPVPVAVPPRGALSAGAFARQSHICSREGASSDDAEVCPTASPPSRRRVSMNS